MTIPQRGKPTRIQLGGQPDPNRHVAGQNQQSGVRCSTAMLIAVCLRGHLVQIVFLRLAGLALEKIVEAFAKFDAIASGVHGGPRAIRNMQYGS